MLGKMAQQQLELVKGGVPAKELAAQAIVEAEAVKS